MVKHNNSKNWVYNQMDRSADRERYKYTDTDKRETGEVCRVWYYM